jgi:hypothetical protein
VPTLDSKIFELSAICKVETSRRAMHFSAETRRKLWLRLEQVLSHDTIDDGDQLFPPASFVHLIRLMIYQKIKRVPALGMATDGSLLAAWWHSDVGQRLYARFSADEKIHLTVGEGDTEIHCDAKTFRSYVEACGISRAVLDGEGA